MHVFFPDRLAKWADAGYRGEDAHGAVGLASKSYAGICARMRGGIKGQLGASDEPRLDALLSRDLGEAAEHGQRQASTDFAQRGVIGQRLVELVPRPAQRALAAHRQVVAHLIQQLPPRVNHRKEDDEMGMEQTSRPMEGHPPVA